MILLLIKEGIKIKRATVKKINIILLIALICSVIWLIISISLYGNNHFRYGEIDEFLAENDGFSRQEAIEFMSKYFPLYDVDSSLKASAGVFGIWASSSLILIIVIILIVLRINIKNFEANELKIQIRKLEKQMEIDMLKDKKDELEKKLAEYKTKGKINSI
jgi:uncharacterized protein YxeA